MIYIYDIYIINRVIIISIRFINQKYHNIIILYVSFRKLGLKRIFSNSTNWEELSFAWKEWRKIGIGMKVKYSELVKYLNKAARINSLNTHTYIYMYKN